MTSMSIVVQNVRSEETFRKKSEDMALIARTLLARRSKQILLYKLTQDPKIRIEIKTLSHAYNIADSESTCARNQYRFYNFQRTQTLYSDFKNAVDSRASSEVSLIEASIENVVGGQDKVGGVPTDEKKGDAGFKDLEELSDSPHNTKWDRNPLTYSEDMLSQVLIPMMSLDEDVEQTKTSGQIDKSMEQPEMDDKENRKLFVINEQKKAIDDDQKPKPDRSFAEIAAGTIDVFPRTALSTVQNRRSFRKKNQPVIGLAALVPKGTPHPFPRRFEYRYDPSKFGSSAQNAPSVSFSQIYS
ncbi:unnamed protein product [Caenorhabditis auriculariae]|uniref:Uncharacterized protein n=1 Tax=Caenorhabditis auriculariae TaxID=2777116 RepID=A0A8S1H920_9PELO|nr:unnamed protein product [Caenorhabditis auriculariae]